MAQETDTSREQLDAQHVPGGMPSIVVEVLEGESICGPDEKTHGPGDTFEIEGPSAIALVLAGHVTIVSSKADEKRRVKKK